MSCQRLSELADIISTKSKYVEQYFIDRGLPTPSTKIDAPSEVVIEDKSTVAARGAVIEAMQEMRCLMLGPSLTLMSVQVRISILRCLLLHEIEILKLILQNMNQSEDILCLQAIYRYDIYMSFDINEEISYEMLSARCGLNVVDLRRILRYAMTNYIFQEPRVGIVAHTALSQTLAQNSRVRDFVGVMCEERFLASARVEYSASIFPSKVLNIRN